jgi:hypothetical protein
VDLTADAKLGINARSDACNGQYVLHINAKAGTAVQQRDAPFSVEGGRNCVLGDKVEIVTITVGAQDNTTDGNSVDLDIPEAFGAADAKARAGDIDLCYGFTPMGSEEKLGTPKWANGLGFPYAQGWPLYRDTKISRVPGADFGTIQDRAALLALWNGRETGLPSHRCQAGDVFIAETDLGTHVLILVEQLIPGSSGGVTLKIAK